MSDFATKDERDLILSSCLGGKTNSKGFVRVNCPVCPGRYGKPDRHHSLGFRPLTGGFRCFRCHVNGRQSGEGFIPPEEADGPEDDRPKVIIDDQDFYPMWSKEFRNSPALEDARAFLEARGITEEHWEIANIHAAVGGRYANRIIVPHEDKEAGAWWGFTSRIHPISTGWGVVENAPMELGGDAPKVLYPKNMDRTRLYNEEELWVETDRPVMLVEGCLDAVWYLPGCVASLGKPTHDHFEKLKTAKRPVVVCLDGDAWEEGRALAYRLRLYGSLAGSVHLPAQEDPNSVDPDWLRRAVANADLGIPCTK